ncbi:flagellar basal body L-ring protein FlgH [Zymobacter sp. IVIA_5232.4 C2]|uniref:flagellar basal body L-ring protein FlgH n=1 Tax=Zymobacter sp. IVIA_5232.4 C2 TaxID=3394855 RepID=UPI0039C0AEF9
MVLLAVLEGCAYVPRQNIVNGPTSSPPQPAPVAVANGSIYQANYVRPLFEDRRPRGIGDILTVVLNEKVNAAKNSSASASREGSGSLTVTAVPKLTGGLVDASQNMDMSGKNDFSGKGAAAANNSVTGTISVTVRDVLPNGNLSVIGERQIGINQGTEYIRLSGIVNPRFITAQNTIQSTQIADARLEYYGDGFIDEAQRMGWLQRFFLNISPF